jgi:hypothetical protein
MSPSFFLIPGLCSVGSAVFEPLKNELNALGIEEVTCIDLNSVDCLSRLSDLTPNPLEADISQVRALIRSEIENLGRDVMLVAHSYGGVPALYGTTGYWKHERLAKGLEGGVIKVLLLSSSLSLPGQSVMQTRALWAGESGEPMDDQGSIKVEMINEVSTNSINIPSAR